MALDVAAGTVGGVAGILACQPFDTMKVRMQTQIESGGEAFRYKGLGDCARTIWRSEGPLAFYKGMVAPMLSNAPINAFVFGVERSLSRQFHKYPGDIDPKIQHMVAGFCAGICQSFIASPAELIKIRLQIEHSSANPLYRGNRECFSHLWKTGGIANGLYRGFGITVARDAPAFAVYFWSYDVIKLWFQAREARKQQVPVESVAHLPEWTYLVSGGLAGTLSWVICHPVDVLKSCVQATPDHLPKSMRSVRHIATEGYKQEGIRFFFRGYAATLARAFPNSAVTFVVYELVMKALADTDEL